MAEHKNVIDWENFLSELEILLKPGMLGYYEYFNVIEVFAINTFPEANTIPLCMFSLIVANKDGSIDELKSQKIKYIGKLKNFKEICGYKFGICTYSVSYDALRNAVLRYKSDGCWILSPEKKELKTGSLKAVSRTFVPKNLSEETYLNRALKKNSSTETDNNPGGSYVLELWDEEEKKLNFILDNPEGSKKFFEWIRGSLEIDLESVNERLGNILIQIPVNMLSVNFFSDQEDNVYVSCKWPAKENIRPLFAVAELSHDNTVINFNVCEILNEENNFLFKMRSNQGISLHIFDKENSLLLAATKNFKVIHTLDIALGFCSSKNRTFNLDEEKVNVPLIDYRIISCGDLREYEKKEELISNRVYENEKKRLASELIFKEYRRINGKGGIDQFSDIKKLINEYGQNGVWILDPYLTINEVANTLLHCPFVGVKLRALCVPRDNEWIKEQKADIEKLSVKDKDLKIEVRMVSKESALHDRFIIFPGEKKPFITRAWSLGTSLNGFGKSHHVLQKLKNDDLIKQTFEDIWNKKCAEEDRLWIL